MRYVGGYGNPRARLMLVGEAPGAHEESQGIPFVGPAGVIVDDCLVAGGVSRDDVYLTNVVKVRPPDNEIRRLPELNTKIEDFLPQLWKEIEEINPNCILAIGNTALKALTSFTGIDKYRGSILLNQRTGLPKVVATIHPASLFHETEGKMRSYRDRAFIQFDFVRAIQQSQFREYRPPERALLTAKNSSDLFRFLDRSVGRGLRKFSLDVETYKTFPLCVGLAFSRHEAMSIPLFHVQSARNPEGIPLHDLAIIWQTIADLLADPQYKIIGQNMKFDEQRCIQVGLPFSDVWFDTMLAFHVMYSELPKRLQFISSILTEEPYYKDELTEYNPKKDKLDKLLLYNAKDAAVEFEVYEKEWEELTEMGMLDWFFERQMPLHRFYTNIENRGVRVDLQERKRLIKKYKRYASWIDRALKADLGYELNVNSPKQVGATLFGDLKCPVRKDTGRETLEMMMLNAVKDDRRRRIIRNILKGRKARKTRTTYVESTLHPDNRARTVFNICGAETGRTSTSKPEPPVTMEVCGFAFQNLTKHGDVGADLKGMFIPDEGTIFIEPDESQAEARVVAHLANDKAATDLMNKKDFIRNKFGIKDDIHTRTTMLVTGAAFEAIDEEARQVGKKTRHAGNYGMGKRRLSLLASISEWRAGKCLEAFHQANPQIHDIFWEEVKRALQDNCMVLMSPHGRRRMFFDRWGEDLFKEAYAYIPQSTVSDHLKFTAMVIERRCWWIEILSESHDSFLAQIPPESLAETVAVIKEEMEKPIDFSRCSIKRGELVIPCEIKIGRKNWKRME